MTSPAGPAASAKAAIKSRKKVLSTSCRMGARREVIIRAMRTKGWGIHAGIASTARISRSVCW
jgi:hypothetical protein